VGQSFLINLKPTSNGVKMWLLDSILYHFISLEVFRLKKEYATFNMIFDHLISKEEMNISQ